MADTDETVGSSSLKRPSFSRTQLALFVVVFALIGAYFIWRSFAIGPLVASLEAEQMVLPSGGSVINDSTASAGKAVQLLSNGAMSGNVNFPAAVTDLTVMARGDQCSGSPIMNINLDGKSVLANVSVPATTWTSYTATLANPVVVGTHSLGITFSSDYSQSKAHGKSGKTTSCSRNLYVDVTNFYGATPAPTPAPTVTLSASPTTLNAGSASTLTWNSTNATACSASGSWSGSEPLTGSISTGSLNSNSAYTLTCNGSGGSANATATVTVTAPTSGSAYSNYVGLDAYNTNDFAKIQAIGVKNVRMDFPSAATIDLARTYGITVLPIADFDRWSDLNGGKGDYDGTGHYPPYPQYYQTWAQRMVAAWSGMANPPKVIECWNEPWLSNFWYPTPDPAAYLSLCKDLATEAWKVWPNETILISADTNGSTNTSGTNVWRKNLIAADTTGFLNDPRILPTTHNYVEGRTPTTVTSQPCSWDLDRFKCAYNDFKAHGHPNPQVWITEFGWESVTTGGFSYFGTVTEQQQADYTKQALQIFQNSGMVAKGYSFMYKSGDAWDYNWIRPDGTNKPVIPSINQLILTGN